MTYEPNLEGLVAWLATQKPQRVYDFDLIYDCVIATFLREGCSTKEKPVFRFHTEVCGSLRDYHYIGNQYKKMTYGHALTRAEKSLKKGLDNTRKPV